MPRSIQMVVAVGYGGVIGHGDQLPWRLSTDLQFFKQLTVGHALIMGRRTYESIGRPLPGRTNVVVSRSWEAGEHADRGIVVAGSLEDALIRVPSHQHAFVVGGAQIYHAAWPLCQRLWLTQVLAKVPGDTFFPNLTPDRWNKTQWRCTRWCYLPAGSRDQWPTIRQLWVRL
jgi:dihydrofolate reductase